MLPHDIHRAFTVVELMVILVVLTIVGTAGIMSWRLGPSAATTARHLTVMVTSSRWSAVLDGSPRTMLGSDAERPEFALVSEYTCNLDQGHIVWAVPPRITVNWPTMGLAFAPDGRPRRCDGSGVGNTTILIEGPRGDRAAVIVASLGRVRWERR